MLTFPAQPRCGLPWPIGQVRENTNGNRNLQDSGLSASEADVEAKIPMNRKSIVRAVHSADRC